MKIIEICPQGFCGGVANAIRKVRNHSENHPDDSVTVLGALVHNDYISRALEERGIRTVEDLGRKRSEMLDDVNHGCVVFTAHGVCDDLYAKAKKKGLQILDASCPFVLKTKDLVRQKSREGYAVLYVGKKGHPEAEAVCSSADHIFLIETPQDIPENLTQPVFVTNQTTMSILDTDALFRAIQEQYPEAVIHDEICNATRIRQQAILNLKGQNVDALIVVGDPSSNNTRQLEAIGKMAGIPLVIRIEKASDLDLTLLPAQGTVAVTSGASTPAALEKQVVEYLKNPDLDLSIPMDRMLDF